MYYLLLNDGDSELQTLFPQGIPTFGSQPDEFVEIYDEESFELTDIQPAYRVNLQGLTADEELKLFHLFASEVNDAEFVRRSFMLLENGWVVIPEEEIEAVIWREGECVFSFGGNFATTKALTV